MRQGDDERAIRRLTETWLAAVAAKDVDRLLELVTDDCVFLSAGMPPVRGREAVATMYRTIFARFDVRQTVQPEEVCVMGEWAFAWGTDSLELAPAGNGGTPVRLTGFGMTLLKRLHDGSWRYARGINSMTPQQFPQPRQ